MIAARPPSTVFKTFQMDWRLVIADSRSDAWITIGSLACCLPLPNADFPVASQKKAA
jgi:hypothetical protein